MTKIFFIVLCIPLIICSCKLFDTNKKKTKTLIHSQKYCFEIVDSAIFFDCKKQIRIWTPGHWYNEYFDGISRNDSVVILYHRLGKIVLDTVATYDPCSKLISKTHKDSLKTYCFQVVDSNLFMNKEGPVRIFFKSEWDGYCDGVKRKDSIVLHNYRNNKHYYDTILNPLYDTIKKNN